MITARGTDLNLIPRYNLPRRMIQWAAGHAAGMITVCKALKDTLVDLGVAPQRIEVLRNGVDLELFRPGARPERRAELGLRGRTLLSVGFLVPRKAHDLAIAALPMLPDTDLLIAGEGPEEASLKALAARLGVAERVRFLGALPQARLRDYYGAADALVLASSREGWANVLLESMACGTPVVASNVWGTPEVVAAPEAGVLMAERTPQALAQAVRRCSPAIPTVRQPGAMPSASAGTTPRAGNWSCSSAYWPRKHMEAHGKWFLPPCGGRLGWGDELIFAPLPRSRISVARGK